MRAGNTRPYPKQLRNRSGTSLTDAACLNRDPTMNAPVHQNYLTPDNRQFAPLYDCTSMEFAKKNRRAAARTGRKALVRKARARKTIERKLDQERLRKEIEQLW